MPIALSRRAVFAGLAAGGAAPAGTPQDLLDRWHDPARGRDVPVRIRFPDPAGPGPAIPVIISHGLGGSRDGLGYLGTALAQAGFMAVHLQHAGSDSAIWQSGVDVRLGMAAAILDVRNALERLRDVAFALEMLSAVPALRGRVDPRQAGVAGHSFGAWTVTHMLGERLPGGEWGLQLPNLRLPDPRLVAGVAISPIPPLGLPPAVAYARVAAPILHITGTNDTGFIEAASAADRLIPYRNIQAPGVLAVLGGAYHASFAGEPGAGSRFNDPTYFRRTGELAALFLRATLQRDTMARALLLRGAFLDKADRIESHRFASPAI